MGKLIVIGESLIDIILGKEYVGGAPLNVSCYASKFIHTIFLNKLSTDYMSKNIFNTLKEYGVDTSFIKFDSNSTTCYSLVTLSKDNERTFSFNFNNASFTKMDENDIPNSIFNQGDIFYFGSVFFLNENGIRLTNIGIDYALKSDVKIAFDINYRDKLFPDLTEFIKLIEPFINKTNILKISDEEYNLIFKNIKVEELFIKYLSLEEIILTLGENGAKIITKNKTYYHEGIKVKVEDTTGCGDAFFGTYLGLTLLNKCSKQEILNKCIQISSSVASFKGALIPKEHIN